MNGLDSACASTILYIDDDPSVITVARMALEMRGFKVLTAGDGLEGLKTFKQNRDVIDAVVLDECMPFMRGVECLKAIRELDGQIGALLVSGNITESVRQEAVSAGVSGCLDKPYHIDELVSELNRVLVPA